MSLSAAIWKCSWLTALSLALEACAASSPAGTASRQRLPVSEAGPALSIRASSRDLGAGRVNVLVYLRALEILPRVTVGAASPDARVHVSGRCDYTPLRPVVFSDGSGGFGARRNPNPLPVVPFCSFVIWAAHAGTYPLDIHVRGAHGSELVAPLHTVIRVPSPEP